MDSKIKLFNVVSPHSPKAAVKLQHNWISLHTAWTEVKNSQRLQISCSGQSHIRLSLFEGSSKRYLNAVKSSSLALVNRQCPG